MGASIFQAAELDEIGRRRRTDKCRASAAGHDYLRKYEFFFAPFRREAFTFLELGVFKGASLRTWLDYFEAAELIGVDCEPDTLRHQGGRVKVILGDLSRTEFLQSLAAYKPAIIIDDASHAWPDQLRALLVLFPALAPGGLYVIEDLHTSFPPLGPHFSGGLDINPFQVLTKAAEYLTGDEKPAPLPLFAGQKLLPLSPHPQFHNELRFMADQLEAVTFIKRACILAKKAEK